MRGMSGGGSEEGCEGWREWVREGWSGGGSGE